MENTKVPSASQEAGNARVELGSAALARLMDEVRNNSDRQPTAYNRMHNRHNR